jgi:ThiF family
MPHVLTLTSGLIRDVLTRASSIEPLLVPIGFNRSGPLTEWLVHGPANSLSSDQPRLAVMRADSLEQMEHRLLQAIDRPEVAAAVVVGERGVSGRLMALFRGRERRQEFERIRLVGPGMPLEPLHPAPQPSAGERECWSRTIGALGEAAWQRLRGLHVALIGCGRTGSVLAAGLARWPVGRLTLIDADVIEPHNLGEMVGVGAVHCGLHKVEALRQVCLSFGLRPDQVLGTVPAAGQTLAGLLAAKTADVLVCAVDNPLARMYSAAVATLFARPLLDVGTGVLAQDSGLRFGADVRLVLPGRCLHCFGGVAGWPEVLAARRRHETVGAVDWRQQRAGSLASLNGVAAHLGLRLLEEAARRGPVDSQWLSLNADRQGMFHLERPTVAVRFGCPLCRWTGRADGAVKHLGRILDEVDG